MCTNTGVDLATGTAAAQVPNLHVPAAPTVVLAPLSTVSQDQAMASTPVQHSAPPEPVVVTTPVTLGPSTSTLGPVLPTAPRTRLQAGIRKPKVYKYGTVRYGNLITCEELTNISTSLTNPNWK
jgi:hypothetical protein